MKGIIGALSGWSKILWSSSNNSINHAAKKKSLLAIYKASNDQRRPMKTHGAALVCDSTSWRLPPKVEMIKPVPIDRN